MTSIKKQVLESNIKRHTISTISTTKKFLEVLFDLVNTVGSLTVSKYSYCSSLRQGAFSEWSNEKISKNLYDLQRSGYIRYDLKSDSVEFTNKARIKIIDKISDNIEVDKKLRFISFDIPETKKTLRNGFRRAIKRIGFRQVQKSLWVIDKNVSKLVEQCCFEYGVEKYVTYIIAQDTDINCYIGEVLSDKNGPQK